MNISHEEARAKFTKSVAEQIDFSTMWILTFGSLKAHVQADEQVVESKWNEWQKNHVSNNNDQEIVDLLKKPASRIPTPLDNLKKGEEMVDQIDKEHGDFLFHLFERWLDEYKYEDINDYLAAIQKRIPRAFRINKGFKICVRIFRYDFVKLWFEEDKRGSGDYYLVSEYHIKGLKN